MKKYLMHGIYILVILFFVVLAQIRSKEAEKQAGIATEQKKLAEKQAEIAMKEAARATKAESEAMAALREVQRMRDELEQCKSTKK